MLPDDPGPANDDAAVVPRFRTHVRYRGSVQRSFDDLGRPLYETTFCVLDIETTGGSPAADAITEIGAVLYRGGERIGTFQTLVNPGTPIPPTIVLLTGITEVMVGPAPKIEAVLPAFLEFVGTSSVIVGHNVRFDLGFLNAAARQRGYPQFANPVLDTCSMARRLLRDEVPNMRLGTLARVLRLPNQPTHRALDDALATADLLHALMERVGNLGVTGLDDLLELPTLRGTAEAAKLRLTAQLPRRAGVYLFRDAAGRVLYVGKATNLRSRVRSYFSTETRRKVGPLLRELAAIDTETHAHELAASVRELQLIRQHQPPYNQQLRHIAKYCYVTFDPFEPWARLRITAKPQPNGRTLFVGPLASRAKAQLLVEAIWSASPLRRCTARVGTRGLTPRSAPCPSAQLGVASCPCARTISLDDYHDMAAAVGAALTGDPAPLLDPLRARIDTLAAAERFEEAADVRDRAHTLSDTLLTQRMLHWLRVQRRVVLEWRGQLLTVDRGLLVGETLRPHDSGDDRRSPADLEIGTGNLMTVEPTNAEVEPFSADQFDERKLVWRWIERHRHEITVISGSLPDAQPTWPTFAARTRRRDDAASAGSTAGPAGTAGTAGPAGTAGTAGPAGTANRASPASRASTAGGDDTDNLAADALRVGSFV